jgi:uncharacterized membrane protein (GlpM family)
MIFFFGTRNYGKVDHVPGLFYLSTQFFYLQFVPLVPTGTHLIIDGSEQGNGFRGIKLGLSGKSVFFAYLRALCMVGGIAAIIVGFISVAQHEMLPGIVLIASGIAGIALFILSYKLSKPSPHRALRLAQEAGIAPEVVAKYFVDAGLMVETEVDHASRKHAEDDRENRHEDR